MDLLELIHTRRSIRRYLDKPVSLEIVKDIISAGTSAPSAGNQQPWHFIVITDKGILKRISEIHPHGKMAKDSAVAIIVCGDPNLEKHKGYWVQDCSACTQNILLAAHAKGLGAVWCGVYPREERMENLRRLLGIPEGIMPFSLIPIGYPAEESRKIDRYREDRVHYNSW